MEEVPDEMVMVGFPLWPMMPMGLPIPASLVRWFKTGGVMRLILQRFHSTKEHTLGMLSDKGGFLCFTLEDGPREVKVPGLTRIPAGIYRVTLRKEGGFHQRYAAQNPDTHKGMLWLRNVPDFEYILIHIGNRPKDTRGCILVGDSSDLQGFVGRSADAYHRVYPPVAAALEAGQEVFIDVRDE